VDELTAKIDAFLHRALCWGYMLLIRNYSMR